MPSMILLYSANGSLLGRLANHCEPDEVVAIMDGETAGWQHAVADWSGVWLPEPGVEVTDDADDGEPFWEAADQWDVEPLGEKELADVESWHATLPRYAVLDAYETYRTARHAGAWSEAIEAAIGWFPDATDSPPIHAGMSLEEANEALREWGGGEAPSIEEIP